LAKKVKLLLQLPVLSFGFFQDGDVWIGGFRNTNRRNGWRYSLRRLRRSQRDQGGADDNKHSRPQQKFYSLAGDFESQYRYCRGMGEACPISQLKTDRQLLSGTIPDLLRRRGANLSLPVSFISCASSTSMTREPTASRRRPAFSSHLITTIETGNG
jgi:hypothetical protein